MSYVYLVILLVAVATLICFAVSGALWLVRNVRKNIETNMDRLEDIQSRRDRR